MSIATPPPISSPPRTIAALDVPAEQVEAQMTLRDARAHTHSPSDAIAYALDQRLLAHPELMPTDSGDPEWDAWLAQRIAETNPAWAAAHQTGGTA